MNNTMQRCPVCGIAHPMRHEPNPSVGGPGICPWDAGEITGKRRVLIGESDLTQFVDNIVFDNYKIKIDLKHGTKFVLKR